MGFFKDIGSNLKEGFDFFSGKDAVESVIETTAGGAGTLLTGVGQGVANAVTPLVPVAQEFLGRKQTVSAAPQQQPIVTSNPQPIQVAPEPFNVNQLIMPISIIGGLGLIVFFFFNKKKKRK